MEPKFIREVNGYELLRFNCIDSTNQWIKEALKDGGIRLPAIVNALEMTGARGQGSNRWFFEKGKSVGFTLVTRVPEHYINHLILINKWIAIQTCRTIAEWGGRNTLIKWPNDIYVNGKKLCGMLLEYIDNTYVLAGIGINVRNNTFPEDFEATSLLLETGVTIETEEALDKLTEALTLINFTELPVQARYIHEAFNKLLLGIGKTCTATYQNGYKEEIVLLGVDEYGRAVCENRQTKETKAFHHPAVRLSNFEAY